MSRLASTIKTFNFHWTRRVLGRGAAVPTPDANTLEEHPFAQVVAEYPWLNIFTELGKLNNGQR